jgi:hypothetical protein
MFHTFLSFHPPGRWRRARGGAAAEQAGLEAAVLRPQVRRVRAVQGRAGARRRQLRARLVEVQVRRRRLRSLTWQLIER